MYFLPNLCTWEDRMSIKFLKLYYCNFKAIAVSSRFNTSPAAILTKSNKNP